MNTIKNLVFLQKVPKHANHTSLGQELYYISIHSVLSKFYVRPAHIADLETLHGFTKFLLNRSEVLAKFNSYFKKENYEDYESTQIFVLLCENVIVGFSVVSEVPNVKYLQRNYHLEKFVNFKVNNEVSHHGILEHFHINLPFSTQFSFFITQISNQSRFRNFYSEVVKDFNPSNSELWRMIPVKPKRVRQNISSQNSLALYFMNPRLSQHSKEQINLNLVLVGCSSTAISFLETLIFHEKYQKFWFTNITIISANGWSNHEELLPTQKYSIDENYLARLGLIAWVTMVPGTVTNINRFDKQVVIGDNAKLSYDLLYLFVGREFKYPESIAGLNSDKKEKEIPQNFYALNNEKDVENFKKVLNETIELKFEG